MSGPTGPVRDSSLQDRKAPGVFIQRTPQPRSANVVSGALRRHLGFQPIATLLSGTVRLRLRVTPSMRSAAALSAATTAVCVAWL